MKTRIISWRNQQYKLVLDLPNLRSVNKPVLAVLSLYEGTGCWSLEDIRLHPHHLMLSPYYGNSGEDFHADITARTPEEAQLVRSALKEFRETMQPNGNINFEWCTYRGIVRGQTAAELCGRDQPVWRSMDVPIMHRRDAGLAKMNELAVFWDGWMQGRGDMDILANAGRFKIDNPHLQPTNSDLFGRFLIELPRDRSADFDSTDNGFYTPSPPPPPMRG